MLAEKAATAGEPKRSFNEMFELAINFLSNPYKLWEGDNLLGTKAVLRLAFSSPLSYHRESGFRTPQTSSIFKALEGLGLGKYEMAERVGFEPTKELPLYTLSRRAPSTTRPPLRMPVRQVGADRRTLPLSQAPW